MTTAGRVAAIAGNTVREALRNRLLYALFFFSVLLICAAVAVSTLSYVEGGRIMQDIGMAGIRLLSAGVAIFFGVNLIFKEVDRRTIFTILSKPLSRPEFLVGKYVGLVLTLWLLLGSMAMSLMVISWLAGVPVGAAHGAALGLAAVELMVVIAVATFFSAFTTPMLASLFTVAFYAIGHLSHNLYFLSQQADLAEAGVMAEVLYRVVPDLELFNLSIQAAHGLPIAATEIWLPVAYGFGYSIVLLIAASLVFARRDFR